MGISKCGESGRAKSGLGMSFVGNARTLKGHFSDSVG